MTGEPDFEIASLEELWVGGVRVESRLSHGTARRQGSRIVAVDSCDAALVQACEMEMAALRTGIPDDARVRLVASARRAAGVLRTEGTTTITIGGISIVGRDPSRIREIVPLRTPARPDLPILWLGGSAAVLFHEAVGHPAEHRAPAVGWPSWLTVRDEPPFAVDDCGHEARAADLLAEPPSCFRRQSFRDVPLLRMTHLVARQHGAPFEVPAERIDVYLAAGGSYDPLTDTVTVDIALSTAGPFRMQRARADVARSLAGASGEPIPYPGVICSREGQELAVGSWAPVVITT